MTPFLLFGNEFDMVQSKLDGKHSASKAIAKGWNEISELQNSDCLLRTKWMQAADANMSVSTWWIGCVDDGEGGLVSQHWGQH